MSSINGTVGTVGKFGNTKRISACKNWCFTYNSYNEKNINDLLMKFNDLSHGAEKYVFQEEVGESGNNHLQGYIKFKKRVRPVGHIGLKDIHWEKTRSEKHSIDYCSDPLKRRNGGRIWVKGIHLAEQVNILPTASLYEWQNEVVQIICDDRNGEDDRSIYWISEKIGNVGKSALVKYLCVKYNAIVLSGKGADMKYGILKYFEKHGTYPSLILLDIPRSVQNYISWSGIEEVKNGCFFSSKYECGMAVFNSPTIICFANFHPDWNRLSLDRWKIAEVKNKKEKLYWKRGEIMQFACGTFPFGLNKNQ